MKHRRHKNNQNAGHYEHLKCENFGSQNARTGIYSCHPITAMDLAREGGAGL